MDYDSSWSTNMDPFQKFLPGVLERFELPRWFIDMADQRSRGKLKFIVFDHANENLIHADYFIGDNYLETKVFEVRIKGKDTNSPLKFQNPKS